MVGHVFLVNVNDEDMKSQIDNSLAVEVKIKGRAKEIYRQCERYCKIETVKSLLLITNKSIGFPKEIKGTPCYVYNIGVGWL